MAESIDAAAPADQKQRKEPGKTPAESDDVIDASEKSKFRQQIIILIIGFILTTICGGLLGSYLQQTAWINQQRVQRDDRESELRMSVYNRISSLIDRRNYRALRLIAALKDNDQTQIDGRLDDYRLILFEWNDTLNSNLALLQVYFSSTIRDKLEGDLTTSFRSINTLIECAIRRSRGAAVDPEICLGDEIRRADEQRTALSVMIYVFNIDMLAIIRPVPPVI